VHCRRQGLDNRSTTWIEVTALKLYNFTLKIMYFCNEATLETGNKLSHKGSFLLRKLLCSIFNFFKKDEESKELLIIH